MRFYLASWVGDGTTENPYRPNVGDEFAAVDLRPDVTVQSGRVLVATPEPVATVPQGVLDIGELAESLPRGVTRKIEDALGVTLDQTDTIQAIIAELLILWGDNRPRGSRTRWRPLKQDHRGRHRIRLLGTDIYDAPVPQGATLSDDFNRADTGNIGGDWSGDVLGYEIVSNEAKVNGTSAARVYYSAAALDGTDHESEVDVTNVPGTSSRGFSPTARTATDGTDTYYELVARMASDELWIREVTAGTETTIASKTLAVSAPYNLRIRADGSTITGYVDDVEELSTTDTEITTGTTAGFRTFGADNATLDNFLATDLTTFDPANLQASVTDDDVTLTWDASF